MDPEIPPPITRHSTCRSADNDVVVRACWTIEANASPAGMDKSNARAEVMNFMFLQSSRQASMESTKSGECNNDERISSYGGHKFAHRVPSVGWEVEGSLRISRKFNNRN